MSASNTSKSANKIFKATELVQMAPNVESLMKLIDFSEAKPFGKIKRTFVRFNGHSLTVQTPKMRSGPGLSKWVDKDDPEAESKDSISLSFGNDEENKAFHQFCKMYDEAMQRFATDQMAAVWLGKKSASADVVKDKYTPIVSVSKDKQTKEPDGKYPDSIKVKLGKKDGQYYCELYDAKRNRVPSEEFDTELTKGCECVSILNFAHIWFGKTGFGQGVTPIQIKTNKQEKIRGYAFIESDDDEQTPAEPQTPVVQEKKEQAPAQVPVESDSESDSDTESESSESEEEEPVKPAPKGRGKAPAKK